MATSLAEPDETAGSEPAPTIEAVAYDAELADRIREVLGTAPTVTEQRMFGGLAFMVRGNMAVAASGQGGLMVRVDPAESARLVKATTATPMIMKGRPMTGWLRVPMQDLRTKPQLRKWVTIGTTYAGSLPAKSPARARRRSA
jgi:TfoX/Sxy family transcriptional regulator of competence genes